MYEQGEQSYLSVFLNATSLTDMLNKADYIEKLYEYDRKLLNQYIEVKEEVARLQEQLEEEQAQLEATQHELEEEQ